MQSSLLIEPHRDTTLVLGSSSGTSCAACSYSWVFTDGTKATGSKPVVRLKTTGMQHLTVKETRGSDGVDVEMRFRTIEVYVKYVRREVRKLSDEDRRQFLEAASELWKTNTVTGKDSYGERYRDINYMTIVHNDLAGNQVWECWGTEAGSREEYTSIGVFFLSRF